MSPIDLLGYLGAVTSSVLFLPQARLAWAMRRDPAALRGLSLGTQVALTANAAIWLAWAVLAEAYPAGVPSLVNLPVAVFLLVLTVRARAASAKRCLTAPDTSPA